MTEHKLRQAIVSGFSTDDGEVAWHVRCFTCGWTESYRGGIGQRGAQMAANEHNRRAHGDLCCVEGCTELPTQELEVSYDMALMDPYTVAGVPYDGTYKVERMPLQMCGLHGDIVKDRLLGYPDTNLFSLLGWS